jgi:sulfite exporter TauE/SafE
MLTTELVSAFLVGLLGSVHCIGMCGGIVGALTFSLSDSVRQHALRMVPYITLYNIGRLCSYSIAGAMFAWLGASLGNAFTEQFMGWGKYISGTFLVLLGLYIAGWLQVLVVLEKIGGKLWQFIEPVGKKFMPVDRVWKAGVLGLLWGWLPCGMVYAMLPLAMASAEPIDGGLIMLAFGLGTLPTLVLMGSASEWLRRMTRNSIVRQLAGLLIILFGAYGMLASGAHDQHGGHMNHNTDHSMHMDHSNH